MGFGISPVMNNYLDPVGSAGQSYASRNAGSQGVLGTSAAGASGTLGTQGSSGAYDDVASGRVGKSKPTDLRSPSVTDEERDRECQTCKTRKYQDGSDEMVSFKSASHISPEAAASAVRGHEQEHVSNAYKKAAQGNGKVISAAVSIHMSVCPECGRSYVSGGTTQTMISYKNEENPYQKDLKAADYLKYGGKNLDKAV
jgi:hypothetical protein